MTAHAKPASECLAAGIEDQLPAGEIEVRGGIAPYLNVEGAGKAADFYIQAFGAVQMARLPPDEKGRYLHIHLYINGGSLMLADFFPEHGYPPMKPQAFDLHLQVDDVDPVWKRAVDAGAEIVMPVQRMFWGHRYGVLRDPFGVRWSVASAK